jgi:hypothetical protein
MQQRRGTAEQWETVNPVLAEGEIGLETDTNKFKIGNGVDNWEDLEYFLDETALTGSLGDYVPLADVGVADGIATLDGTGKLTSSQIPTSLATTSYVDTAVSNLVDAAPAALDTLNELAAALGDDASFATSVTTSLSGKQDKVTGVSDTEIGYLDGVTSSIQTQINSKAPIDSPTFTGNVHLPGTTTIDGITSTELSYLNGVTSPIQTQLGDKADLEHTHLISDVTNLQTALDGKAASSHTHTFSNITDTQISSPATGEALVYNGTKWSNQKVASDPMPQIFMLMGA